MADEISKDTVLDASFKALARYLGTEGAVKTIFPELHKAAKDKKMVKELLGKVSGLDNATLDQLESDYLGAKSWAKGRCNDKDWAPVSWSPFKFDSKPAVDDHNKKMTALLEDVVGEYMKDCPGGTLDEDRLKMHMHGLAARQVQNYINSQPRGESLGNFGG